MFSLCNQCQGASTTQTIWSCYCWRTPQGAPQVDKDTQHSVHWKEINNLQMIMKQPKTPRMLVVQQLRLFLDRDSLLHCGGCIHNAPVCEGTKFPYLLPSWHSLSKLVIFDIHVRFCHSGTTATLTALRQFYWIPAARQYIKSILHHCVVCCKISGKPYPAPDPPPLPQLRIQDVHPFTFTRVDFTGALYVQLNKQKEKVYVCLFTCITTCAINLEIMQDLTTQTLSFGISQVRSMKVPPQYNDLW